MTEPTEPRDASHPIDAPITSVTVFRDGARIARTGVTQVAAGSTRVVIAGLPATADTASVRVAARGRGLSLLNVDAQRRFGTDPLRERVAELRAEVERAQEAVRELDDEDAAEQAGLGFLEHLSDAAATALARSVGAGRTGYDELARMAGHLTASTANTLGLRRGIAARKRVAQRELDAATARLSAAETRLDTVAPGEEFEVQLGVDDQIKVERKLRRRTTSKAMLGGARTIDIAYEITVENHRDRKAQVSVHDHIPVSTDGDIKVRSREATPPPDETDDLGELTWSLTLDPAQTAAIRHRFTVEHPAQVAIAGL